MEGKEIEKLKSKYDRLVYEKSAKKYQPDKVKYLLIAESPPYELTKAGEKRLRFKYK